MGAGRTELGEIADRADVHHNHMRDLDRLADAGNRWAHEAREKGSFLLYAAAGGFENSFRERAEEAGLPVVL